MRAFQHKPTSTSAFGTSGRIAHDSSQFYKRKMYEALKSDKPKKQVQENSIPDDTLNRIFCGDSRTMRELPDNSVHLMVTSPPYNVGKTYDKDMGLGEYRQMLKDVFKETHRVLVDGGRVCINVANLGRKPYIPLHSFIIEDMHSLGFYMRGEVLWNKGRSASPSTAWGTWQRAENPVLRDVHEYILIFCKNSFTRSNYHKRPSTISRDEFLEFTKSIWNFDAQRATKVGHPAPFPLELPYRAIQLYTFEGDTVLDPFVGSGTTCLAALKSGRNYVGYDVESAYCDLANNRINQFSATLPLPKPDEC